MGRKTTLVFQDFWVQIPALPIFNTFDRKMKKEGKSEGISFEEFIDLLTGGHVKEVQQLASQIRKENNKR